MRRNVEKYFDGYEKVIHWDEKGRKKTEYVYRDEHYVIDASKEEIRRMKQKCVGYFVLYTVLYFAGALLDSDSGKSYAGIVSLIILIPWMISIGGLYNILRAEEKMEKRRVRYGFERLKNATSVCMVLSAAQIVAAVVVIVLLRGQVQSWLYEILYLVFALAQTILAYRFWQMQKTIQIEIIPNS
jgi:hypothetical protein